MATDSVKVDTGTSDESKEIATYALTEDEKVKELQRVVLNDSEGAEILGSKDDTAETDSTVSASLFGFIKGIVQIWNDIYAPASHWINVNQAKSMVLSNGGVETDTIGVAPIRRSDAWDCDATDTTSSSAQPIKAAPLDTAKSNYLTDITISSDGGAACNVIIQDDNGTPKKLLKVHFGAAAGVYTFRFITPKFGNAGKALNYIASSATPHISVSGGGYEK